MMWKEKTIEKNVKPKKPGILKKIFKISGIFSICIILLYIIFLKPVFETWGATNEEISLSLPGDEIVPVTKTNITRAISINAPPENIYPWLIQMGINKGGLYSYDWLENLLGLNVHSAESIIEKWQNLKIGDNLLLGPMGGPDLLFLKKNEYLVFGGVKQELTSIWGFYLFKENINSTRLVIRSKNHYPDSLFNFLIWKVITEPLHFFMEEK
jgi:hypothetical protein